MNFVYVNTSTNKKNIKALGKRVRQLRQEQKITQSQLAFESGIPREQINRIERGRHSTTVGNLFAIADALGIKPKELLDFEV